MVNPDNATPPPRRVWLDLHQAAEYLNMSEERLQDLAAARAVKSVRPTGRYRFHREWLDEFRQQRQKPADSSTADQHADAEESDTETILLNGLHDHYHDLFVGPCDRQTVEAEADFPVLEDIGVLDENMFDCSYEDWSRLFRQDARQAAREREQLSPISEVIIGSTRRLRWMRHVREIRLKDGPRILARRIGWVVVDKSGGFLISPEDDLWMLSEFPPDMPAMVFATPEAAVGAWKLSQEAGKAIRQRRGEALQRLDRE